MWPTDQHQLVPPGARYSPGKTLLRSALTAALLLLPSALFVNWNGPDDEAKWAQLYLADAILCMFVGAGCMLFGYASAARGSDWSRPQPMIGLGAGLVGIAFLLLLLVGSRSGA